MLPRIFLTIIGLATSTVAITLNIPDELRAATNIQQTTQKRNLVAESHAFLRGRATTCSSAYAKCPTTIGCCPTGESCCGDFFCASPTDICCTDGLSVCYSSEACCGTGCMPGSATCCSASTYCRAGNKCYSPVGSDDELDIVCCTDSSCRKYVGADAKTTTVAGVWTVEVTRVVGSTGTAVAIETERHTESWGVSTSEVASFTSEVDEPTSTTNVGISSSLASQTIASEPSESSVISTPSTSSTTSSRQIVVTQTVESPQTTSNNVGGTTSLGVPALDRTLLGFRGVFMTLGFAAFLL